MPAPWGSGAAPSPSLSTLPARHLLLMVRHTWAEAQPGAPSGTWLLSLPQCPPGRGSQGYGGPWSPLETWCPASALVTSASPSRLHIHPSLSQKGVLGGGRLSAARGKPGHFGGTELRLAGGEGVWVMAPTPGAAASWRGGSCSGGGSVAFAPGALLLVIALRPSWEVAVLAQAPPPSLGRG